MPVFLQTRTATGSIADRIQTALDGLNRRLARIDEERAAIAAAVEHNWQANALSVAPGTVVLERVARRFGVTFSKDKGDSERLALELAADSIPTELKLLLRDVASADAAASASRAA